MRARRPPPPALDGPDAAPLARSYARCRALHRRHGTTYYWATWLLPASKRPHVHALYGFCRYADDIVDDLGPASPTARAAALCALGKQLFADLARGRSEHPVLAAVVHSARTLDIDASCFARFLRAMAADLHVRRYQRFEDLAAYMDGSAAVIGEMMLPVLEPTDAGALGPARDLGVAFQLTNFLRDVGEDLRRDRVYLPQEDIEHFGAAEALARRQVTPQWVALLRFEIARTRELYRRADPAIASLPGRSGRCVGTARQLYGEILERIEAAGYDVFSTRARVPTWRKVALAARAATQRGTTGSSIP